MFKWSQRAELNRGPTDYESDSFNKQQLRATNNRNKNKLLKVMLACGCLLKVVFICPQVAYFWPTEKLGKIQKTPPGGPPIA